MGYGLYFYYGERHRRPHVDVRGGSDRAVLDVVSGEVLSGRLPPAVLRAVQALLRQHQAEAVAAFYAALEHRPPGTLGDEESR